MKKNVWIGALAISIAAFLWGLDGVVLTPRLFNLNVPIVVFMFHALPFSIMNIFLWKEYRHLKDFTRSDYFFFSIIAIFGGSIGTLAIVKALFLLQFKHLTIVALIQKLQPVFALTMAHFFLKEKLSKHFFLWSALAVVAGYFLTFGNHLPDLETGKNTILAALYALLAAFSFGSGTVFSKKVLNKFHFKTSTFYRYGFTTLFMGIFILITGKLGKFAEITPTNWTYFFIIAFTTGSGAIFLYYFGLKKVSAMLSTICELWFPLSAIFLDFLINKSVLSPIQFVSALILIASILRLTWLHNKEANNIKKIDDK